MKRVLRTIKLVFMYFKVNLSSALAYRSAFLMQAGGMMLSNATFVFFWWVAFGVFKGRIGGYSFEDVMFIWALMSAAFGISNVFFGNAGSVSSAIITGELDVYLLQPKPPLLGLMCSRTQLSAWGDLIYGVLLLAFTQGTSVQAWLVFVPASVVGAVLIAAISLTAHSLTFFFGDASMAGSTALEFVINLSIYPIGIFPAAVRFIMRTIIPAAFIVHVPLQLARSFSMTTLLGLAVGVTAYCFLAYRFFLFGLKRYESGNLIITRL